MKRILISLLTGVVSMVLLNACSSYRTETFIAVYDFSDHGGQFDLEHNARNSLDYHGVYHGVIPSASGSGIDTTIQLLENGTFNKRVIYLGKGVERVFDYLGPFVWNEAGNTVTLQAEGEEFRYFVGENILFHLDPEGNRITGRLADQYKLLKLQ